MYIWLNRGLYLNGCMTLFIYKHKNNLSHTRLRYVCMSVSVRVSMHACFLSQLKPTWLQSSELFNTRFPHREKKEKENNKWSQQVACGCTHVRVYTQYAGAQQPEMKGSTVSTGGSCLRIIIHATRWQPGRGDQEMLTLETTNTNAHSRNTHGAMLSISVNRRPVWTNGV